MLLLLALLLIGLYGLLRRPGRCLLGFLLNGALSAGLLLLGAAFFPQAAALPPLNGGTLLLSGLFGLPGLAGMAALKFFVLL